MTNLKIACIIPTYNGRDDLERLLASLSRQTILFDLFIVDSSSTDGTYELAKTSSAETIKIPSSQFNHGGTRQMMVERHSGFDVYIFMTQDAYLVDDNAFAKLTSYFQDSSIGSVCGRQLAHIDADLLSKHARLFNYPPEPRIKSIDDSKHLGMKTAFISNSFSAYRTEALLEAGGFPEHVILSEDMYVAAKMLILGWKVAYAGDASCRHSHNYTISEEFRRYFDIGVFHSREAWIRERLGGAGGEGLRFVKSEFSFLGIRYLYLWPSALVRNSFKLSAYKLGQKESSIPISIKKKLSMHKRYWDSLNAEKIE